MAGTYGTAAKLGVGAADPVTLAVEFDAESLALDEEIIDTSGLRGTRTRMANRFRTGRQRIAGQLSLKPTPSELEFFLRHILGGTPAANVYPLAESLPTFYYTIDRGLKVFKYAGVGVSQATFRASVGSPLELSLDLVAQTETVANAGTFPSISPSVSEQPFQMADLAVSLGGATRQIGEIEIVVNNAIDADRFLNSATLVSVQPTDRVITSRLTMPYGDSATVYGSGAAGITLLATFTNGTKVLSFEMPKLVFPRRSPGVQARGETNISVQGTAAGTAAGNELSVSLANS